MYHHILNFVIYYAKQKPLLTKERHSRNNDILASLNKTTVFNITRK